MTICKKIINHLSKVLTQAFAKNVYHAITLYHGEDIMYSLACSILYDILYTDNHKNIIYKLNLINNNYINNNKNNMLSQFDQIKIEEISNKICDLSKELLFLGLTRNLPDFNTVNITMVLAIRPINKDNYNNFRIMLRNNNEFNILQLLTDNVKKKLAKIETKIIKKDVYFNGLLNKIGIPKNDIIGFEWN